MGDRYELVHPLVYGASWSYLGREASVPRSGQWLSRARRRVQTRERGSVAPALEEISRALTFMV